jgi:hypothetical protein
MALQLMRRTGVRRGQVGGRARATSLRCRLARHENRAARGRHGFEQLKQFRYRAALADDPASVRSSSSRGYRSPIAGRRCSSADWQCSGSSIQTACRRSRALRLIASTDLTVP